MKITSLHIQGFLGARTIDLPVVEPITLIATHTNQQALEAA